MATHRRRLIREEIAKLLRGKTLAGNRVYPNQSTPAWAEELPVILIYPTTEGAELYGEGPRELKKTLTVAIECIAQGSETQTEGEVPSVKTHTEDLLDQMALEVECELSRDDRLACVVIGGKEKALADDLIYTGTEFEYTGEGGQPIGSARLSYLVTYYETVPLSIDKTAGLGDFKKVNADWSTDGDDDTIEASDSVDIPQT